MPQMTIFQAETETGNVVPKKINQMPDNSARSKMWTAVTDCWQLWQRLQALTAIIKVVHSFKSCHELLAAVTAADRFDSCY